MKGEWKNDQEIIFYTTSKTAWLVSGGEGMEGFIKNTLGVKYQIIIDDRLLPKYLWMKDTPVRLNVE